MQKETRNLKLYNGEGRRDAGVGKRRAREKRNSLEIWLKGKTEEGGSRGPNTGKKRQKSFYLRSDG